MPCLAKIDFGTTSSSTKTAYNPPWDRKLNHFVTIVSSRWIIWTIISSLKSHRKLLSESYENSTSCCWYQHLVEGTVSPGHVRTSPVTVFITFLNVSRQADVSCITIYLKLLILDRETNRQSSTVSNIGLVPWGHAEPGSDADDVPLLLYKNISQNKFVYKF